MDINFELYRIFYHGAKRLNFTAAAEDLFVTQSAVSQSIKSLEDQLGCHLFFRNGRHLLLTEEGKILFSYVENAYMAIKAGESNIESINDLSFGTVRIGASDTISKYYLLEYMKTFHETYPGIKLSVTNRPSSITIDLLHKNKIDFAVINVNPEKVFKDFELLRLKSSRNVFVASFKLDKPIHFKELEAYAILSLDQNATTRSIMDQFASAHDVHLNVELEFGSIDLVIEMTKIGLGVGFVNLDTVLDEIKNGTLHIIDLYEEIPSMDMAIIYNKSTPLPLASKKFVELICGE